MASPQIGSNGSLERTENRTMSTRELKRHHGAFLVVPHLLPLEFRQHTQNLADAKKSAKCRPSIQRFPTPVTCHRGHQPSEMTSEDNRKRRRLQETVDALHRLTDEIGIATANGPLLQKMQDQYAVFPLGKETQTRIVRLK